jgi:hypothetical protein
MPSIRKKHELGTLAERLIMRHLRVSLPDARLRGELQRGRNPEPVLDQRVRCIAVVGAGASATSLSRGEALADDLEKQFLAQDEARRAELFRLQRVYSLNPAHFETRLAALSRTPDVTQIVRQLIAERYSYRHPTIFGYELLAHLMKHRYLDAIITFNFDELLDQSLDDELGIAEYRRLVSDRDCDGVINDPDAPDYLPLYVKLHGTAAEPDTLRFTREAYYELPQRLMGIVEGLLDSHLCVVANVGSAMSGFDLHRLLRIPQKLEIYDLSYAPLGHEIQNEIAEERKTPKEDSLFSNEPRDPPSFALLEGNSPRGKPRPSSDGWLRKLAEEIANRCGDAVDDARMASLVRFRSVDRHEAVADILGPEAVLTRWVSDPWKHRNDYIDYLRHRTIVELAFSGAKARGLAQVSWLAEDRCGVYYECYRREAAAAGITPAGWSELRASAGLDENEWLPDVVESQADLCAPDSLPTLDRGQWRLREFVPKALAEQVIQRIGAGDKQTARMAAALRELQGGSEVEIHSMDDHVCAKTFDTPTVLRTVTALNVFTRSLFKGVEADDEIYISCETGEWLITDETMGELLAKQKRVEVITAFDLWFDELREQYGEKLVLRSINPWRHNRHMTIVCRGQTPMRAVYFARRLRTPQITPVYLRDSDDAARVMRAFGLMRSEVEEESGVVRTY